MTIKNKQTGLQLFLCMLLVLAPFGSLAGDLTGRAYAESSFSGGTGTVEDPYIITTPAELNEVRNHLDKYFILGSDIDLTSYVAEGGAGYNGGAGWEPIGDSGNPFSGTFDGAGHTVTGLWINRPTEGYVGLFGHVDGGTIQNIGLIDISVTGKNLVGGLAGYNISGTISHAWSTGHVTGNTEQVGALVGYSSGSISNVWSGSTISGVSYTGGLVGNNQGSISFAYATGTVSGDVYGSYIGGLVGSNHGTISNTWTSGAVTGGDPVGGLIGYNGIGGSVSDSYWDIDTTEQAGNGVGLNDGGTVASSVEGLTTSVALSQSSYSAFDFYNDWFMIDGSTRPFLQSEWSETIRNTHQLQLMAMNLFESYEYSYTLADDIDLTPQFRNKSDMWATDMTLSEGKGFAPIKDPGFESTFMGEFDGQDHTISGLYIQRPAEDNVGLFGVVDSGTLIQNIHLNGGSVHGYYYVGALVGVNNGGDIYNVSTSVKVTGDRNFVGGLVGRNHLGTIGHSSAAGSVDGRNYVGGLLGQHWEGSISLSYAAGNVQGSGDNVGGLIGLMNGSSDVSNAYAVGNIQGSGNYIGGLVGQIMDGGSVEYTYSAGSVEGVEGSTDVGGLIGYYADNTGQVQYSYYDQETSGQSDTDKGEPRTTTAMKQQETFEPEWDFETIWGLYSAVNNGYPVFQWQYEPSSEARLADLVVQDTEGNIVSLSPSFSSDSTAYEATVTYSAYGITVTPTAWDSKATITVNGEVVSSGEESAVLAINEEGSTITIIVTAEDGETAKIYTLTVNRSPEPGNPEEPPRVVDFTPIEEEISACGSVESEVHEIKDVYIDKEGYIYLAPKSADIQSQEDLDSLMESGMALKYMDAVAPFEQVTIAVADLEIAGTYVFYAVDTEGLVSAPSEDAFTVDHVAQLTDQQLVVSGNQLEAKTKVVLNQGCAAENIENSYVIFTLMQDNTVMDVQVIAYAAGQEDYAHSFPVSGLGYKVKIFVIRNFEEDLAQSLSNAGNNLAEPSSAE